MARVVFVSNRVQVPEPGRANQAGGLAPAVKAALRARSGLWFGWSGETANHTDGRDLRYVQYGQREYATLHLSEEELVGYYRGYSNRVLWPLLHDRADLIAFSPSDLSTYLRVNETFAEMLLARLRRDDVVWVHDYHLFPLAAALRRRGVRNKIGFFLHVPFPDARYVRKLPDHHATLGALRSYDLIGMQTEGDRRNMADYLSTATGGGTPEIRAMPIGINAPVLARAAALAVRSPTISQARADLGSRSLIVGVDRLDYSKGLVQKVDAYRRFLESHPAWHGQVSFIQICPNSREDVPEYAEVRQALTIAASELNRRFGSMSWVPLQIIGQVLSRATLAGLYRIADVGLVTPMRDGMNLVAKEFVACQQGDDPGVLVLSKFAGAASTLDGALMVNPHDIDDMAETLDRALSMSVQERRSRQARMSATMPGDGISQWSDDFIERLTAAAPTRLDSPAPHRLAS